MLVQGVIDLLDAAVDVTLKRKGFGLGLLIRGNRHTEVLSNPPQPHKTESPALPFDLPPDTKARRR